MSKGRVTPGGVNFGPGGCGHFPVQVISFHKRWQQDPPWCNKSNAGPSGAPPCHSNQRLCVQLSTAHFHSHLYWPCLVYQSCGLIWPVGSILSHVARSSTKEAVAAVTKEMETLWDSSRIWQDSEEVQMGPSLLKARKLERPGSCPPPPKPPEPPKPSKPPTSAQRADNSSRQPPKPSTSPSCLDLLLPPNSPQSKMNRQLPPRHRQNCQNRKNRQLLLLLLF